MSGNYPDGVSDNHPYFNESERPTTVDCTSEEAQVIPSFAVKAQLNDLADFIQRKLAGAGDMPYLKETLESAASRITTLQKGIDEWDREGDYECQWVGEMELPVSEEAHWDCPRCGVEQTTDTLPEEDPDRGWDDRDDD